MPNFVLTSPARTEILCNAVNLLNRTRDYALANFPMTTAQVQYAVLREDQVNDLRRLDAEGIRTIEHHTMIRMAFLRDILPELTRGLVVRLSLPEWIVVARATMYGVSNSKFSIDESHYLVPDLSRLDDAERAQLVSWINLVVRQHRLAEIAEKTVGAVINDEKITPTTGHVHALWPFLATLTNDKTSSRWSRRSHEYTEIRSWRDRFRDKPRRMAKYAPDANIVEKYAKRIAASTTVLTGAQILDDYRHPRGTIEVDCEVWERLPNDLSFD